MGILSFDKPKKIRSTEEHNKMHQSDAGVDGTYVPNMSREDQEKWKAKHIKGDNERIEIRKSIHGANIVIIVRKNNPIPYPNVNKFYKNNGHGDFDSKNYNKAITNHYDNKNNIKISMNGSAWLTFDEWEEMKRAIWEAQQLLGLEMKYYLK